VRPSPHVQWRAEKSSGAEGGPTCTTARYHDRSRPGDGVAASLDVMKRRKLVSEHRRNTGMRLLIGRIFISQRCRSLALSVADSCAQCIESRLGRGCSDPRQETFNAREMCH
jgi:hypothetical protein